MEMQKKNEKREEQLVMKLGDRSEKVLVDSVLKKRKTKESLDVEEVDLSLKQSEEDREEHEKEVIELAKQRGEH